MNKELYLSIKNYLNSSDLPAQKVSVDLGEYIKNYGKTPVDKFTITYTFYEYIVNVLSVMEFYYLFIGIYLIMKKDRF